MSYIEDVNCESVNVSHNHINLQVFQLLEDLEAAGNVTSPRGLKTKQANLATLDIDPLYSIMNFTPRKFNWKYFAGELAWYLKAETSIDFISNFSSFWKDITPSGHANSNYGSLLFKDHPSTLTPGISIEGEGVNQLEWAFNCLVNDENTRQAVMFFNSPYFQTPNNKDFVCTMYINFFINQGHLEMKVQMRSNDIFFGLTYDAPWFASLHQSMYLNLLKFYPKLRLGMYYHCADNIHFYERHFELANNILDNNLENSIRMRLKYPLFEFKLNEIGNYHIEISEQAKNYVSKVEDIVSKEDITNDKNFWKSLLEDLYEISGETPVVSELD
jgi:thymidylate synthase